MSRLRTSRLARRAAAANVHMTCSAVLPENFIAARDAAGFTEKDVSVNLHDNYDHSYYFISTFAPGALADARSDGQG